MRLAYAEGRVLQLSGDVEGAAEKFREVVELDLGRTEPLWRLVECLEAAGDLEGCEANLRRLFRLDRYVSPERWGRWFALGLDSSRESLLGLLSSETLARTARESSKDVGDMRWILERLANGEALRINCGGVEYTDSGGKTWSRDRFFSGGDSDRVRPDALATEEDHLCSSRRWFDEFSSDRYRIPLPRHRYRVTLRFAEVLRRYAAAGQRVFNVYLKGEEELTEYDVFARVGFATPDVHSFEIDVEDGILDIEFRSLNREPMISAIEIERVNPRPVAFHRVEPRVFLGVDLIPRRIALRRVEQLRRVCSPSLGSSLSAGSGLGVGFISRGRGLGRSGGLGGSDPRVRVDRVWFLARECR